LKPTSLAIDVTIDAPPLQFSY